jgi:hypothetical protein
MRPKRHKAAQAHPSYVASRAGFQEAPNVRFPPIADISPRCEAVTMKLMLAVGLTCLAGCGASGGSRDLNARVTPVEIWTGGDDGLTQRLADAVADELRRSARFSYGEAGAVPDALKAVIPTHVRWREVGDKTRVTYRLELERDGRRRSARGGSCWEAELKRCAQQVVQTIATAGW